MNYPTMQQVDAADRESVYRWFLKLPLPRRMKIGKGREAVYVLTPEGGEVIAKRIYKRWQEFGGHDRELLEKILKEE